MSDTDAVRWPDWWDWELELSSHLLKRMIDREFTEVDLRSMMVSPIRLYEDAEPGRWIVETRHNLRCWHVIVEPDRRVQYLVVITAYPIETP